MITSVFPSSAGRYTGGEARSDWEKARRARISAPKSISVKVEAPKVSMSADGQASVTFTAPASNGGSAIVSYTVTSSPSARNEAAVSSPM